MQYDEQITKDKIIDLGDATIETKGFDFSGVMDQVTDRRAITTKRKL